MIDLDYNRLYQIIIYDCGVVYGVLRRYIVVMGSLVYIGCMDVIERLERVWRGVACMIVCYCVALVQAAR